MLEQHRLLPQMPDERPHHSLARRRSLYAVVLGLLLLLWPLGAGTPSSGAVISRKFQIQAAFVFNFTRFVTWPSHRFAGADSPIIIGVLDDNPFGDELAAIVKNRKVGARAVEVRMVATAAEAGFVHILYVGAGHEGRMEEMREALRAACVLTVGESRRFAELGGIIDFVLDGDKVRFEINLEAGEDAGLKISAQLLNLATTVRRKS